ncbi:MAG: hypothetical protein WBN40_13105 [Pseudomonadales bacterium]
MKAFTATVFGLTTALPVFAHDATVLSTAWLHELAHIAPALPFLLVLAIVIGVSVKFKK